MDSIFLLLGYRHSLLIVFAEIIKSLAQFFKASEQKLRAFMVLTVLRNYSQSQFYIWTEKA